ncbi:MAG: hypothetical protein KA165_03290 [Saprospiraceae bacterium]|nr:hypothetical protein [Saprospiraceae bacterium]
MNYRYPGPQSFREEDEPIFHGRTREAKALHELILAQSPVVLFSKSGMGKTSLLQAGLIPRLYLSAYDPVKIRLNDTTLPPERQMIRAILPGAPPDLSLWETLHRYRAERFSTPILIFDQFEEVFTLYPAERRVRFVQELSSVINGKAPANIGHAVPVEPPRVRIILSIRSDLLHFLHQLSAGIPSILRNRFELSGLQPAEATEAIINPAAPPQTDGAFAAPPFSYAPEALSEMLSYLSRRRQTEGADTTAKAEIESFQLQLLCRSIEEKIIAAGTAAPATVTPSFYGSEKGIEKIISDFYAAALAAIPRVSERRQARRLIEDHLVQNERRVGVAESAATATYQVPPTALNLLVDKRLLRRDVRETGAYVEVSHDTLLTPILESKARWERQQASLRILRWFVAICLTVAGVVFVNRIIGLQLETERNKTEIKQTLISNLSARHQTLTYDKERLEASLITYKKAEYKPLIDETSREISKLDSLIHKSEADLAKAKNAANQ